MRVARTVADTAVADQWSPRNELPASAVPAGAQSQGWWVCAEGHEWSARIAGRTSRRSGCPYCSGRRRIVGVNDFASLYPELLTMWHPDNAVDPSTVGPRANRRVRWICGDGHEWEAPVSTLTAGHGCPYCARRYATTGVNDLATTHPDLAREWDEPDFAPTTVTAGSNRKARWMCGSCGHRWRASIASRARARHGCPACGQRRAAEKQSRPKPGRSLGEAFPLSEALSESAGGVDLPAVLARLVPGLEVRANDRRAVPGYELDAYLPTLGIGVEYNGVYYHSERFRGRDMHAQKGAAARAAGIRLFSVWEDDWCMHRDVVIRALAAKLGVTVALPDTMPGLDPRCSERLGARSLTVGEVDGRTGAAFLTRNHLQGAVTCSRRFVLMDDDGRIRALLALRSPRGSARNARRAGEWEIVRYATRGIVPGGFSRLLAHAERALAGEVTRWVTFADAMISDGALYERTGFVADRELAPDYRYAGPRTRWVRTPKESYQRKRFREDPSLEWDEEWTEAEAASRNGLVRVWDAGKTRYVRDVDAAAMAVPEGSLAA